MNQDSELMNKNEQMNPKFQQSSSTAPKSSRSSSTCSNISSLPQSSCQPTKNSINSNEDSNKKEMTTACPLCFKAVTGNLEDHFQLEHREYECAFCGLLFESNLILNQHMLTVHPTEYNINGNQTPDETLTCPICNVVVKEGIFCFLVLILYENMRSWYLFSYIGIKALEVHVDSHLTGDQKKSSSHFKMVSQNKITKNQMACASRTSNDSSLVANVDKNFEMDQVMTLDGDSGGKKDKHVGRIVNKNYNNFFNIIKKSISLANLTMK